MHLTPNDLILYQNPTVNPMWSSSEPSISHLHVSPVSPIRVRCHQWGSTEPPNTEQHPTMELVRLRTSSYGASDREPAHAHRVVRGSFSGRILSPRVTCCAWKKLNPGWANTGKRPMSKNKKTIIYGPHKKNVLHVDTTILSVNTAWLHLRTGQRRLLHVMGSSLNQSSQ